MSPQHTFYEFFAGGGMARAGLGKGWECTFANDFDAMKARTYSSNWGHELRCSDVATLKATDLPGQADLAWASFPCQDLSLAGDYQGLGNHADETRTRSGTFWPFWHLMQELRVEGRAPKIIVLENVYGAITSNTGKDFGFICSALANEGYRFGAMIIDAKEFVPQSRSRLFIIAARADLAPETSLLDQGRSVSWHPSALVAAYAQLPPAVKEKWLWWKLPKPRKRTKVFGDLIEEVAAGVRWDTPDETKRLLGMMTPLNRNKVRAATKVGTRVVGGVYKRTRIQDGVKAQRAEVRFDNIAGCLRTPRGGSSRQRILVVEGVRVRSRLLSPREAARLMGLPDSYRLPENYNDAYHLAGDGVVVQVVRHLARNLIEPLLSTCPALLQAAE